MPIKISLHFYIMCEDINHIFKFVREIELGHGHEPLHHKGKLAETPMSRVFPPCNQSMS